MIGTLPMRLLAPLEYRLALDAVMPYFLNRQVLLLGKTPALTVEAEQRLSTLVATPISANAILWIEPLHKELHDDIVSIRSSPTGTILGLIASRPLASLIPERRHWPRKAVGMGLGGVSHLRQMLNDSNFKIQVVYNFHTLRSIILNQISRIAARYRNMASSDNFTASARMAYSNKGGGFVKGISTVVLVVSTKEIPSA